MSAYPEQELARRAGLAALLFRLEQRHAPDQFEQLIDEVLSWFRRNEGFEPLKHLFTELVRQAMQSFETIRAIPYDLVEMQSMLATQGEYWKQQWFAEGEAKGKAEGKAEGQAEAKADALIRLLSKRFGPLKPARQGQIRAANPASIEVWFDRAIDARDLTSVFDKTLEVP